MARNERRRAWATPVRIVVALGVYVMLPFYGAVWLLSAGTAAARQGLADAADRGTWLWRKALVLGPRWWRRATGGPRAGRARTRRTPDR